MPLWVKENTWMKDQQIILLYFIFLAVYQVFTIQEIQKIVVFEGAFEKIFSIIKEEGGSEGGVVVQVMYD